MSETSVGLSRPITAAEYNASNPGANIKDTDGDGKITLNDRGVTQAGLDRVCHSKAPGGSQMQVSTEALVTLGKHNIALETKTVNGKTWDQLRFKNGEVIRSYGGYDSSPGACHYNRSGMQVIKGRNDHEVRFVYEDAKGKHEEFLDLITGQQTRIQ